MIIPKVGDWVHCQGIYDPGKVFFVDLGKKTVGVNFFTEWTCQEDVGSVAEKFVGFSKIEKIITDPAEIERMEKELFGEVDFETGELL